MSDYAIGDVQGCFDALMRLLEAIHFNEHTDRLWFVGDLVNRGPESLKVLRFISTLKHTPIITLGNHDLHLLSQIFIENPWQHRDDTLSDILNAPDAEELGHWLRRQHIFYEDTNLNVVMCHAGIAPIWNLEDAHARAHELETVLSGPNYRIFLANMYGNEPNYWQNDLAGMDRLRVICNYFTRMRYCDANGHLALTYKGSVQHAPIGLYPWFAVPNRQKIAPEIIFGHWSALMGVCPHPSIHALDTGYVWGAQLTALRIQDMQRFSVS